ncbi:MAG: outer membrane protein TolC [Paraglaciecola sp.]|jgi:outer membrane protein TolC
MPLTISNYIKFTKLLKLSKLSASLLISLFFLVNGNAQTDTTTLTYQEFLTNIIRFHPIAKQADLRLDFADAEWMLAKGNLDPVLTSDWNQKNFDDKLYYSQFQGKLKIPTILGVDFVAGYENTEGIFLNPENNTDQFGLWNIGVEVNLIQGLWINERRTALQQAKIFRNIAENEREILTNELLYSASLSYLDWQQNYFAQQVILESIELAETYFDNTKQSYLGGEKTAMDTLEALLILQNAMTTAQFYEGKRLKAQQNLENYLWFNNLPLILENTVKPETYEEPIFEIIPNPNVQDLLLNHPAINEKLNKLSYFEAEQRLKREKLKPKLKIKFNPLLATSNDEISPNYSTADYKWGFDFSFPLFLRSARAGIQQGQIKLLDIGLDIENKRNELRNKIEASLLLQVVLRDQLALQQRNITGYERLLEGENQKFLFGESSVFLLNKRQEKYIDSRLKLIETYIKLEMELLNYLYYINGLAN